MNESKVGGLKWFLVKQKGCVLHFSLIFLKIIMHYFSHESWVMLKILQILLHKSYIDV